MIEIKVTDPYGTPPFQLRAIAALLLSIANEAGATVELSTSGKGVHVFTAAPGAIHPDDNPAAGTAPDEVFGQPGDTADAVTDDAATVFADPAQVFGQGAASAPAAAPFTAAVDPSSTAPGATPGTLAPPPPGSLPSVAANASSAAIAAVPVPPGPANAPGVELDVDRLPWDGRIHASSKAKNADGRWRGRRGVDEAVIASVTAELHAAMGAPGAGTATPPPPPPPVANPGNPTPPPPPPPPAASGAPGGQTATQIAPGTNPGIDSSASNAQAQPGSVALTFPQLIPQITARLGDGRLTQAGVQQALTSLGLPTLPSLATRPDLVPSVATLLGIS